MKKETIQTIAIIIAALLFCFADSVFAQPFIGVQALNKGIGVQTGFLVGNIELTASYKPLTTRNDVAKVSSLTAGYRLLITKNEINNYSILPSVGIGNYRLKDFTAYDADPTGKTGIKQNSKIKPIIGINFCKDANKGQMFISLDFCNKVTYYGVGIRAYFYRILIPHE